VRAQTQYLESERDLANEVIEAYYDLVRAIKEAQIDSVLFVRDSVRSAANRASAAGQQVSRLDSLKFLLATARSDFDRTQSRQELAQERANFNELLGLGPQTVIIPDTVVRIERLTVDEAEGLAYARANRLDLKLSQLSVENDRAGLRDARKTSPITVELDGTIGFDGNAEDFGMRSALTSAVGSQDRSTNVQLRVSVPIFDRFEERYAVREAANELTLSEISLEEQQRELVNEVHLAAQRVRNALTQLGLADTQFQITRQTLEIQTERFGRGEIPSAEFLIDQADAREAEVDLLEAQVEVLLANEQWKQVLGVPPFSSPLDSQRPALPRLRFLFFRP
jgi:outer membrane protein TolC